MQNQKTLKDTHYCLDLTMSYITSLANGIIFIFFLFDEAKIKSEISKKRKVQPQPKFSNFMISSDEKKKVEKTLHSSVLYCKESLQLFSCKTRKEEFKQYGEPLNPRFVVL
eukprot:TRINITY_DN8883_c0_g1_i2.p1 TRINITY_DN8883_c0_g1~~TRINITY_DN8883_c0_g1_i2.p1  ORF type:complete len:111 (-),score=10.62 TRINITY_DN8883_c0_g1_i2:127-459(-)